MPEIHEHPETIAALEALLFHYGDPIAPKKIAEVLGMKEPQAEALVETLAKALAADPARGLMVLKSGREVQLVTKPEMQGICKAIIKEEFHEELTPAALETLSLIAYLGPVSRPTIDYIRGVNSSYTVRNLMMRGLIERSQEEKGHAFAYRTSFDFLKHMGLASVEELPEYAVYRDIFSKFEAQERAPQEGGDAAVQDPENLPSPL